MVERIKVLMAHYQLNAARFSDAIGMQRSAVSHVLSGRNKPSLDFVLRIKKHFPEISLDWLTLGEGEMVESTVSSPAAGAAQNLFSTQPDTRNTTVAVNETTDKKAFPGNVGPAAAEPDVKDEDAAYYGLPKSDNRVVQVLFIYDDGTFNEFKPRRKIND